MAMEYMWGLIGGARGNRFCTKRIKDVSCAHCGVGSHAMHNKVVSEEGHAMSLV
jgi:hypothetical protein